MRIVIALVVALGACDHDTEPTVVPAPAVLARAAPERPVLPPPAAAVAVTDEPDDADAPEDADDATDVQVADAKPVIIDLSNDVQIVYVDRDVDDIPDVEDRCPDAPENNDGYEDVDGCPDPAPP